MIRLKNEIFSGVIMILYAMVVYPLLGFLFGHSYPAAPVFGVAPCPTTIFTFGLFLCTVRTVPKSILIIPLIWSVIGFTAALHLGIYEDVGLLAAGGVAYCWPGSGTEKRKSLLAKSGLQKWHPKTKE
jgi:hypothetical protein